MRKFIYKVESNPLSSKNPELLKWLNVLGQEGWEMTGLVQSATNNHFYFKKEVTSRKTITGIDDDNGPIDGILNGRKD